jgi:hypothetical protein
VAWLSADGVEWRAVRLPEGGESGGSMPTGLLAVGDELLAVGSAGLRGLMWSSTDRGATWSIVEREGIPEARHLESISSVDDVLVVSGLVLTMTATNQFVVRSTDGGKTWETATSPPPHVIDPIAFPVVDGHERFFLTRRSTVHLETEPELCYASLDVCRSGWLYSPYVSGDGDRWSPIDTSGLGMDAAGRVESLVVTDDGRVLMFAVAADGIRAWTWPSETDVPTTGDPVLPTTDVDILKSFPVEGERYGLPLDVRCGMEWIEAGGRSWRRSDDGPEVKTEDPADIPSDWPHAQLRVLGFVTLVEEDLIEYSIGDDEVIATYEPTTEEPPDCP